MTSLILMVLLINLGLSSCASLFHEASAPKNGISSTTHPDSMKSQSANSNNQKSPIESKKPRVHEPTREELERLIPSTVRQRMQCSIEEKVTAKPAEGAPPLTVSFDASASFAPCGKIVKWTWDFGDGTSAKGSKMKHTYRKPGEYVVNVNLADKKGNVNFAQLDYVVRVSAGEPTQLTVKSTKHVPRNKTSKSASKN